MDAVMDPRTPQRRRPGPGPLVFISVAMAWEDLGVASAAYEAWAGAPAPFGAEGGLGG
ncbi:hypothetical protein AB0K60_17290 [Thermopolyspora sp. NPDC052614]|uniref:hypothetical protein n=1 Tax=Thermopolyspora sp. NPDC052614 TaxID=3155682 RepID=UPI00342EC275